MPSKLNPILFCCLLTIIDLSGCTQGQDCDDGYSTNSTQISYKFSTLASRIAQVFSEEIEEHAKEQLNAQAVKDREILQQARSKAEADYQAAKERKEKPKPVPRAKLNIDENHKKYFPEIRYNSLIAEFYDVENAPRKSIFVRDGQLSELAESLLSALENVDEHALDIADYEPEKLRKAAEHLHQMRSSLGNGALLNAFETEAISRALEAAPGYPYAPSTDLSSLDDKRLKAASVEWLCDTEHTPVPRAAAMCEKALEYRREAAALENALEFAIADAWMAYAAELKFGNLEKFSEEERKLYTTEENPNDIHPKYHARIVETRLAAALSEFVAHPDRSSADQYLENLIPHHEQYAKLQALRTRYKEIVNAGGWDVVPPDRMFAGGHAPLVKNLKSRLSVEGYYSGTIDDAFDAPLTEAIKKYQKHHQLEENGEVGEVFWRSLNVPANQRLAEIEVNIRRWHKTLFEPSNRYVYINIPSFTVEFWNDNQHVSTHKVVVGSSTRICNTRTHEWELMNSTHLMHAKMTYIVFNPYWNVPPRIEVDEFLPKMAADPHWLENSDFEYVNPRGGGRVLRQKPGENNSLGKVKLIFPNRYNVYLHDTPKQGMFEYPVRAFSHGCMRVEKALDFAREILEADGQWHEKEVNHYYKQTGEHATDLITPVDVFIEYHTVTVDDDNEPYFLADVYKIIRDEITPPTAAQRRCDPATDRTSQYRSGGSEDSGP